MSNLFIEPKNDQKGYELAAYGPELGGGSYLWLKQGVETHRVHLGMPIELFKAIAYAAMKKGIFSIQTYDEVALIAQFPKEIKKAQESLELAEKQQRLMVEGIARDRQNRRTARLNDIGKKLERQPHSPGQLTQAARDAGLGAPEINSSQDSFIGPPAPSVRTAPVLAVLVQTPDVPAIKPLAQAVHDAVHPKGVQDEAVLMVDVAGAAARGGVYPDLLSLEHEPGAQRH